MKARSEHIDCDQGYPGTVGVSGERPNLNTPRFPTSDSRSDEELVRELTPKPGTNCSGKHSRMLAYARMRALPIADYINPEHPIQKFIVENGLGNVRMKPNG